MESILAIHNNRQNLFYQNDVSVDKRACFLDSLKSKSLAYKRYTKSPLRYGGGKTLAVGLIIKHYYVPRFWGCLSKIHKYKARYLNALQKLKDLGQDSRLQNLSMECESFETVFEKYPNDFELLIVKE